MKVFIWAVICMLMLFGCSKQQTPVSSAPMAFVELTVTDDPTFNIPADFTGISFESDATGLNHRGVKGYLFTASNKQLITLFKNTAIRSLRIGGSTVDNYHESAYNRAAIDSVFAFAKAVGIKVIYSLPLLNASADSAAATAQYIWANYKDDLECFSIGNEPNCPPYKEAPVGAIHSYEEYFPIWQKAYNAVISAVPEAKFTGPDSGGWNWTEEFARDMQNSGRILYITHHQYPNGKPFLEDGVTRIPADTAIKRMLSPGMLTGEYTFIFNHTGEKVHPYGFRCRMTESNDYLGGINGASNAMSSVLWALDYMHWQALRGLCGINFHNNQWLKTCTFTMDSLGEYKVNPKALAIRAFDMMAGGRVTPVIISNSDSVNLTAYAVKGNDYLYVTVINKEHGQQARQADVAISAKDFTKGKAEAMYIVAPGNDARAMTGITLGGDSITNYRPWQGKWSSVEMKKDGLYNLNVPESSAVIVKIPVK